jgi:penicillin amidase
VSRLILARRIALSLAALSVAILVGGTIAGTSLVRRPFPTTSGEIAVPGLEGRVTVLRDGRGIPQIYADNAQDLFRAQGFVHAQDRFFQMDFRRHVTAGRLAELIGHDGLEADRVIRTLGWRRVAEAELPLLKPQTRQYLQAYADGVNAYIEQEGSPSKMAVEYLVLGQRVSGYRVEPWSPADSLAWLKAMAWDLRSDYTDELTRARLHGRIPVAQINELYPPYPYQANRPILSGQDWSPDQAPASAIPGGASAAVPSPRLPEEVTSAGALGAYAAAQQALEAVPQLLGRGRGMGSNSWVVAGDRSSTGKPLLANDPHLDTSIPGVWHQVGLHCRSVGPACPFGVAGFSFAGMPGVIIGHNAKIAWATSNMAPDVSDFYLEQVRGDRYLRGGEYLPLTTRRETIAVAGRPDVTIDVRSTVHGPLLSDVSQPVAAAGHSAPVAGKAQAGSYAVSLAWTGLLPGRTADAVFAINVAENFAQFRAAARSFAVPAQNLLYADTEGHIGYQAPGQVPVRRSATAGSPPGYWPAPGWDPAWDWTGFVPFERLPHALDPDEGFLVAANQAVTASPRPFLTTQWDYGFRAQRIRALLEQEEQLTPERMAQIQGDTRNEFAPVLVEALLEVDLGRDEFTKEAQAMLRDWDFTSPVGRSESGAAAAYYHAVWSQLLELTFDDELPDDLRAAGGDQWMQAVAALLEKPRSPWWDNRLTPGVTEGQAEIMRLALVEARLELTQELGKDPGDWEWGKLHRLTMRHSVFGADAAPAPARWLFNRGPYPLPGGSAVVNANAWNAALGYSVTSTPSMRMVVDLSDLDASRWVNQTGTSGHAFHDNYDDQTGAWARAELYPWPFSERAVREAADDELTLVRPSGGQ